MPKLFLLLLCSIQLPGKYVLIKLSEKGKTYYLIYWMLLNLLCYYVIVWLMRSD
jgi:hypothetical protein